VPDWVIWIQGPLGALVGAGMVIAALVTGKIVPGVLHREIVADLRAQRDEWKAVAQPSLDLATELLKQRAASGPPS
jgi:hypothetical protein